MMSKKLLPILASAILLVALAAAPAVASTIYDISTPNTALSPYPAPYATVTVNLTSATTATITFTGLTQTSGGNTYIYEFGAARAADLNVNATSFGVSNISFTGGCTGAGCPAGGTGFTVGSGNVSGFGSFNLTLTNNDGATDAVNSITFTLTNKSGTWLNASAVLDLNLTNYLAAHIFVFAPDGSVWVTGYASNGGGTFTPEASTGMLFSLAIAVLLGAAFVRRERFDSGTA